MTGIIDRLERGGWITRERDPSDRRGVVVQPVRSRRAEVLRLASGMNAAVAFQGHPLLGVRPGQEAGPRTGPLHRAAHPARLRKRHDGCHRTGLKCASNLSFPSSWMTRWLSRDISCPVSRKMSIEKGEQGLVELSFGFQVEQVPGAIDDDQLGSLQAGDNLGRHLSVGPRVSCPGHDERGDVEGSEQRPVVRPAAAASQRHRGACWRAAAIMASTRARTAGGQDGL